MHNGEDVGILARSKKAEEGEEKRLLPETAERLCQGRCVRPEAQIPGADDGGLRSGGYHLLRRRPGLQFHAGHGYAQRQYQHFHA